MSCKNRQKCWLAGTCHLAKTSPLPKTTCITLDYNIHNAFKIFYYREMFKIVSYTALQLILIRFFPYNSIQDWKVKIYKCIKFVIEVTYITGMFIQHILCFQPQYSLQLFFIVLYGLCNASENSTFQNQLILQINECTVIRYILFLCFIFLIIFYCLCCYSCPNCSPFAHVTQSLTSGISQTVVLVCGLCIYVLDWPKSLFFSIRWLWQCFAVFNFSQNNFVRLFV